MRKRKLSALIVSLLVIFSTFSTVFAVEVEQQATLQENLVQAQQTPIAQLGDLIQMEQVQIGDETEDTVVIEDSQDSQNDQGTTSSTEELLQSQPSNENEVVVENPTAEDPAKEEPATEEPAVEEPATEDPTVGPPVVEVPGTTEPAVEVPIIEEPATEQPVIETPIEEVPITTAPAVEVPVVTEAAVEVPVVDCTLSILHVFQYGDVYCEDREVRDGIIAGETVRLGDYTYENDYNFVECVNADETVQLIEGENQITLRYTLKDGYYIAEDEQGHYVTEGEGNQ